MKKIFVDGYNVLNSWPGLRETIKYNLDSARKELIDMLQNYAAFTGYKVYIIFDAHLRKGSLGERQLYPGVEVIYTREGETADNYIEKIVNNIGRRTEVSVVTSDSLEQQITFQRGATRISSTEFYYQVIEVKEKIRVKAERIDLNKNNKLADSVNKDILDKLEKIRRNR